MKKTNMEFGGGFLQAIWKICDSHIGKFSQGLGAKS